MTKETAVKKPGTTNKNKKNPEGLIIAFQMISLAEPTSSLKRYYQGP
jgi:hypothetical protein